MEEAFTSMINENRGLIYKVCNLYCAGEEDRRDLFQEIVLQLWRSFPRFRGEASVSTWMYRIALNTAITDLRKTAKTPRSETLGLAAFDIPDPGFAPGEDTGLLLRALQQLSAIEKAIILLYLDNKSYEEMSSITGISRSNVGVRLNRAKIKLSKIIKTNTV